MRSRIVAVCAALLAVAWLVAGCSITDGQPVQLLIRDDMPCYTSEITGLLVVDAKYGTAIEAGGADHPVPVAWRPGFTGRRIGAEVEVRDPSGNVTNTTGQRYTLPGGYGGVGGVSAFLNCNLGRPS